MTRPIPSSQLAAVGVGTAWPLAGVLALAAALRLLGLGGESFWADEAFTWWWTRQPLAELWGPKAETETNPPLYYTFAWLGRRLLGDGEAAVRTPAALFGVAGVAAAFLLGRAVGDHRAGLLAALLTALSAPHVYYSQEARAYALLSLLGTLAVLGCLTFLRNAAAAEADRRKSLLGLALYVAGALGALYAHNTAVLIPAVANLAALAWWLARCRRPGVAALWVGANLLILAGWSWWLPHVLRQAAGAESIDWLEQPSPARAALDLARLYGLRYLPGPPVAQALPGAALLGLAALACALRPGLATFVLAGFALGVPALLFLLGLAGRPVWVERVAFWPLPLGLTLAAVAVLRLRPARLRGAVLAAVLGLAAANLGLYYAYPQKEPYREVLAAIEAGRRPGDAVLFVPVTPALGTTYYTLRRGTVLDTYAVDPVGGTMTTGLPWDLLPLEPPAARLPTFLALDGLEERLARDHGRVWVLYRRRDQADPEGAVHTRLARRGDVVGAWSWRPFLELALIEFRAGPPR